MSVHMNAIHFFMFALSLTKTIRDIMESQLLLWMRTTWDKDTSIFRVFSCACRTTPL